MKLENLKNLLGRILKLILVHFHAAYVVRLLDCSTYPV